MDQESAWIELQDPALPQERLAEIAYAFPALRTQVVSHPSMYPGLWNWLGSLGDPEVTAAMYEVAAGSSPANQSTPKPSGPSDFSTPRLSKTQRSPKAPRPQRARRNGGGGRRWPVPTITGIVAAVLVAGVGVWWFNRGDGGGDVNAEIGTEGAVAAGVKVAARLSGNDEEVAARQAVAGPELFYYAFSEDDISETLDGEPFINNEVIVEVAAGEDGLVDPKAALKTAEAVAKDLDARVVGIDGYQGSYQLLLPESLSDEELLAAISTAGSSEGVAEASANTLTPITFSANDSSSLSPTGRDRDKEDGAKWSGHWGAQLGNLADANVDDPNGGNWGMQALGAPVLWDAVASEALDLQPVTVGVFDVFYEDRFVEDTLHDGLPKIAKSDRFVSPLPVAETLEESESTYAALHQHQLSKTSHGEHVTGIIAAEASIDSEQNPSGVRGVAPNTRLVLASPHYLWYTSQKSSLSTFISAIFSDRICLTFLGLKEPQVINISVGSNSGRGPEALTGSEFGGDYADILSGPLFSDILIVKAAGNEACTAAAVDKDAGTCRDAKAEAKMRCSDSENGTACKDANAEAEDVCSEMNMCRAAGSPDISGEVGDGELKARAHGTELEERLLSVGAAAKMPAGGFEIAPYSNDGADVIAPGSEILSTVNRSDDGTDSPSAYGVKSGTSMAAPHVTGLAAVIFGVNPDLTASQVKRIIEATANSTPELYWNETGDSDPISEELTLHAPLVNGVAAAQVALLSKPSDGSPGIASDFEATLKQIENGGVTAGKQTIPAQLLGTWCPPDQLSSTANPAACLNLETYFAKNPGGSITASPADDLAVLAPLDPYGRQTTRSAFSICSQEGCEEGDGLYDLTYYPPGAVWECLGETPSDTCPTQTETMAQSHDISYPSIVQTYRLESGEIVQSEPYLLDLGVPVASWGDYTTLPFVESTPSTGMDLTQIAQGDFSSIAGYWSPKGARTVCADFQEDSSFKVGGCGTDMDVLRGMSGTGLIPDPDWSAMPFTEPAQAVPVSDTQLQLIWTIFNYGAGGRPGIYVMFFEKGNGTTEDRLSGTAAACSTSSCGGAIGEGGEWLQPFPDNDVTWLYRE